MSTDENKTPSEQKENDLAKQIKISVKGLYYSSETDAPVRVFAGSVANGVTQENLLSQIKKENNTPVQTVNFDDFFSKLIALQDWFGDEEKAAAEKYAALRDLLKNNLKDLNVFKVGSSELDVYVVGLDSDNKLVGIKTQAVET